MIKDLKIGEVIEMFLLVETSKEGKAKNDSLFVDFKLKDISGKIDAKLWDTPITKLDDLTGSIVKVRGTVGTYMEAPQITIEKSPKGIPLIRKANADDKFNIAEVVKVASVEAEKMFNEIHELVNNFKNEELKELCNKFLETYKTELIYYPGAQFYHHAYKAGLLEHIYSMLKPVEVYTNLYNLNKDLLCTGVILHDIGKISCMNVSTETGIATDFTLSGDFNGHMIEGIKALTHLASNLKINPTLLLILENMIISHHYESVWGAYEKPKTKEAMILHFLDICDSKLNIACNALNNVEPNTFSEKTYELGEIKKLYNYEE